MKRFTNAQGQTTVEGKLRLTAPTVLTRFDKTITLQPGTTVDYIGLEGAVHIVSLDTPGGTFSAVKFTPPKISLEG